MGRECSWSRHSLHYTKAWHFHLKVSYQPHWKSRRPGTWPQVGKGKPRWRRIRLPLLPTCRVLSHSDNSDFQTKLVCNAWRGS